MAVFFRQGLRERINLCLFCLSLADLLYMLHSFLLNVDRMHQHFAGSPPHLGPVFRFIVTNHLMGFRGFSWVSGLISTVIACERCLCVVSPLRAKSVLRTRTTAAFLLLASLAVLAAVSVATTRWGVACVYHPDTRSTATALYSTRFYRHHKEAVDTLTGWVVSLALPALYIGAVSATTAVTLVRLRTLASWRQRAAASGSASAVSAREVALTRMLVGASVLYVLCSLPVLALGVVILAVPDMSLHGRYYNAFNLMVSFFELFSYVNSSSNFFVYCFLGTRYKETLGQLFACGGLARLVSARRDRAVSDPPSDSRPITT